MIDEPQIVTTEAQATAVIRLVVPRAEIQTVMGPAIGEVIAVVRAQDVGPAGPVFTHHPRVDPEVFDFEVGVPVSSPAAPAGRVVPGTLPATLVAHTVYRGGYEDLGAAWDEFDARIRAMGHTSAPGIWERYVRGPESGADPSAWETELNHPLGA
jgi:effector-binding domain-containing protein